MLKTRHLSIVYLALLLLTVSACFTATSSAALQEEPVPPSSDSDLSVAPASSTVPLHPLSIATLRGRTYEVGDLVIEQTLTPGINYDRYIASYQSDGLKIYALLTVPWAEKPPTGYPVVIFNHGYIPPEQYRTTERYLAYTDAFASNGYIVVKSDYRGHGSSEGDAESAYGNPGYVIDVLNALAAARRHPDADPNRVGMWGHSMGGYITLRAMVAQQDIKAGVIWAGVVASYTDMFENWARRGRSGRRGWRTSMVEEFGTPADNPDFWNTLSANSFLADLSGPIQLHHGTADHSVPVDYSITLDEQIRAAGGHSELFLYDGDDHNIATNRDDALTLSVVFFDEHVKNAGS